MAHTLTTCSLLPDIRSPHQSPLSAFIGQRLFRRHRVTSLSHKTGSELTPGSSPARATHLIGMTSQRSGMYFSRTKLFIAALFVLILLVIVGTIVGFVARQCPSSSLPSPDSTALVVTTPDPKKPWLFILLPRDIVPSHYVIILTPNFYTDEAMDFKGEVKIEFDVRAPSPYILLHIKDIDIDSFSLYNNDTGQKLATGNPFVYEKNNFWVLPAKSGSFPKGSYRIEMKYRGSLKGINGFYKSSYYDPVTSRKRHIVSSKFEPVDARRAFPSFDEPHMKAEFTAHLRHRAGYIALSNMNNVSTTKIGDTNPQLYNTKFARSVKMSTYLVCFVVCDFGFTESSSRGKPFRVFAPKHKVNQTLYALKVGAEIQDYFETYFDLPYALPKQDMIAVPNFASGAMEHWGLITYRETALLYDPTVHSLKTKFNVAKIVSHELAHMWFGNVVTMDWWDDLWLNEGFASFASYKGIKIAEPSWDTFALARITATRNALTVDDVTTSHPIIMEVNTPAELMEAFDTITYLKGQSVILMLESLMGKTAFKTGIRKYMRKFEFKNAKTKQLWSVLSKETNLEVNMIMNTWTLQKGYPIVTFDLQERSAGTVKGNQTWFLLDPSSREGVPSSNFNYLWWVRIDCLLHDGSTRSIWMNKTKTFTSDFSLNANDPDMWFLCNKDGGGFYRVNYPAWLWLRLANMMAKAPNKATATQRATLIDDVFAIAQSGQVSYEIAMTLIQNIEKENEFPVWMRANYVLSSLLIKTRSLLLFGKLRKFVQRVTEPTLRRIITTEGKTLHETFLRRNIIGLSCRAGSQTCLTKMKEHFNAWLNNQPIPLDIRDFIIKFGFKSKDTEEMWNELWKRYRHLDDDALKIDIMSGLISTSNQWLIYRLLNYAMNGSLIKGQDFYLVISRMISQPIARPIVWTWFRENWLKLVDRFTLESRHIGKIILSFAPFFYSEVQLEEMKAFFAKYPEAGAGARSRQLSLSQVESNLRWIAANERSLQTWLDKNVKL